MLTHFPARGNETAYTALSKCYPMFCRDNEDIHWLIVDSWCNQHFLSLLKFLHSTIDFNMTIRGIGDNKVTANKEVLFLGYFRFDKATIKTGSLWASLSS